MSDHAQTEAQTNLEAQGRLAEIIGAGDFDRLDEVLADDLVDHDPAPDQSKGPKGIGEFWTTFKTAFPDVQLEPVQTIATEDYVVAILDVSGTHEGDFQGHPATHKTFKVRGIQVGKFKDGKMTDRWGATDAAGIMQQLGLS